MELLERRRTLEQTQALTEGGGINDGKYIVIRPGNSVTMYVSCDYGQTMYNFSGTTSTNGSIQAYRTGSVNISSKGVVSYPGDRLYQTMQVATGSVPTSFTASGLATSSVSRPNNHSAVEYSKAFLISSKENKGLILGGTTVQNSTQINTLVPSPISGLTPPRYWRETSSTGLWIATASAAYLVANEDSLNYVCVGVQPSQRTGYRAFANSMYIMTSWGTWNNLGEIIAGTQSVTNDIGAVRWSSNGKYCGAVKGSTLFLSQDHGASFEQISFLSGSVGCFDASQKFGTLYIAYSGSSKSMQGLYRSEDLGQTWIHVYTCSYQPSITVQYCPIFTTNDAGDKLFLVDYNSSGQAYRCFYSWDRGETWNETLSYTGSATQFSVDGIEHAQTTFDMSRDHVNF